MPLEIYEIVAGAARYWFLFLMILIVFRSFRWYRKDQKQQKKQLKLMPDAGYVGEMVVVEGQEELETGTTLPVSWEGVLGYTRFSDICVPVRCVAKKHCWFRYEEGNGLVLEPFRGRLIEVDGAPCEGPGSPAVMGHGSWLKIGDVVMRLRMFSGYETGTCHSCAEQLPQPERNAQMMPLTPAQPQPSPEQYALWQQQMELERQRQMLAQQQAEWMQWTAQQQQLQRQQQMQPRQYPQPQPVQPQQQYPQAQQPPVHPDAPFMRPASEKPAAPVQGGGYRPSAQIEFEHDEPFYPLEMDGEGEQVWPEEPEQAFAPEEEYEPYQPYDEDMTDATLPPRSHYVGEDESRKARQVLDKYLGGGGMK